MSGLNPKQVEHLSEPGRYLDGDGLYLVISSSGGKSWLLRYQLGGKRRDMGLGPYPTVALKAARLAATEARALIMQGRDPLDERKAEQQRLKEQRQSDKAKAITFKSLAEDYHRAHFEHVTKAWRAGWLSKMQRYVFPVLGELSPASIDTELVILSLRPIWNAKPRTANEVRGQIESVLDSAKALGLRTGENPARWRGHLDNLLSRADKKRAAQKTNHPSMPWHKLPAFMGKLAATTGRDAQALQLVILTAARAGMVRLATWDEFDLEAATWNLPAERMKTRQAFSIPLPEQAVELLRAIPRTVGSPYLFPGSGKSGVMGRIAFLQLLRALEQPDITTHGFRATFRTWASECTHYPREVCELALAHDERDQTEAAYSRSNLLEKRRELMQVWADFATTPPASNVVHGAFGRAEA
ncbi:integrase arm-type DNA-binding domain-containing protein [Pseudomonas sp. JS3066]|uniref:tyrosine-type recombinase/integrase n=1 Tax=Pseudomonas sp. JS3066 TaxID=3090665 RepID=UPI002E7C3002|nr:integrase arm-type DNA-binding domain-containing protein [Pseudomonas sp. JS3066]WVK92028.1 integrase arm-type DNA-binding domain-containing protein [Pseudomonas sp. JS3066]